MGLLEMPRTQRGTTYVNATDGALMTTKWYDANGELWTGGVFIDDISQLGIPNEGTKIQIYPNFVIGLSGVRRAVTMDGWIILPGGEVIKGRNGGSLRLMGDDVYEDGVKVFKREEDGRLV